MSRAKNPKYKRYNFLDLHLLYTGGIICLPLHVKVCWVYCILARTLSNSGVSCLLRLRRSSPLVDASTEFVPLATLPGDLYKSAQPSLCAAVGIPELSAFFAHSEFAHQFGLTALRYFPEQFFFFPLASLSEVEPGTLTTSGCSWRRKLLFFCIFIEKIKRVLTFISTAESRSGTPHPRSSHSGCKPARKTHGAGVLHRSLPRFLHIRRYRLG